MFFWIIHLFWEKVALCSPEVRITDWITAFGTAGATTLAVLLAFQGMLWRREDRKVGLAISDIDGSAMGRVINGSRIPYSIKLQKYTLVSNSTTDTSRFLVRFEHTSDKRSFLQNKIKRMHPIDFMNTNIAPGEELPFHLHDLAYSEEAASIILLAVHLGGSVRYYLYRWIGQKGYGRIRPIQYQHPTNTWFRMHSF